MAIETHRSLRKRVEIRRVELAPAKIRVNVLCPVMAATGLLESFMGKPDTPENRKLFVPTIRSPFLSPCLRKSEILCVTRLF